MSVKKYIIGLAATFAIGLGAGTYIGTTFNKDIKYGFAKAERVIAAGSEALHESYPESVQNVNETMAQVMTGKNIDEIQDEKKERIFGGFC